MGNFGTRTWYDCCKNTQVGAKVGDVSTEQAMATKREDMKMPGVHLATDYVAFMVKQYLVAYVLI